MPSFFVRGLAVGVAAAVIAAAPARADTVVPDDQIVQGSVCAGPDCVNNESFGFDTVRLKGPVLRLAFLDTSTSSGFPSNDWALTANDADGVGTESYFAFTDASAGTSPLRILAGTPTDTLRLDPDGGVRLLNGALLQRIDATTTENASAANGAALVTALATLPLSTYEYTADAANTRHLGPQAADFNSAFGLGAGTTELAPADVAGVALATTRELAARLDDLTGERGAVGPQGPKGATGPTGPRARPSSGLAAALAKLARLERGQIRLRARNLALRREVRDLRSGR
jgi:hypothetical protein